MRTSRIHTSALAVCSVVVSVALLAPNSFAQLDIALPGVEGAYDVGLIAGEVTIPTTYGATDARLVVSGTQISGLEMDVCSQVGPYVVGSEIHLYMDLGGMVPWIRSHVNLSTADGTFTVEMPLNSAQPPYSPHENLAGPFTFELCVGYDPNGGSVLCIIRPRLPVVTITSAHIVSELGVGVEVSTWGAVKGLFR